MIRDSNRGKYETQRVPDLTIIVPVWNRVDIVERCLDALEKQETRAKFEIVVVDDGSEDGTDKLLEKYLEKGSIDLKVIRHENKKNLSAARNTGLRQARAAIVLFLDADIVAKPNVVEIHVNYHRQYPDNKVAILGNVSLPEEWARTAFVEISNAAIAWDDLEPDSELPWWNFRGGHISAKKNFLLSAGGFDERLFRYEDYKLGLRLMPIGLRIIYANKAVGFHYHNKTPEQVISNAKTESIISAQLYNSRDSEWRTFLSDRGFLQKGFVPAMKRAISAIVANRVAFPVTLWTATALIDRFSKIGTLLCRMLCYHTSHVTFKRELKKIESNG